MTKLTSQPLYQEILKTAIDTFAFFNSVAWDALIPAQLGAFAPEVKSAIRQDIRERWLPIMKPELEALLGLNLLGAGRPYFEDDPAIRDAALAQALAFGIESPRRQSSGGPLPANRARQTHLGVG